MKILYYNPHPNLSLFSPSGPGTHMREVIEALERKGHTVIKFIAGDDEGLNRPNTNIERTGFKALFKWLTPDWIWQSLKDWDLKRCDKRYARKLERLIESERPDVIYERAYYLMASGVITAKKFGIPLIMEMNAPYTEEKIYLEGKSFFIQQSHAIEKLQVQSADKIYVVSSALLGYFQKRYPDVVEKIVVIPNAINPFKSYSNSALLAAIRSQYRIRSSEFVIGFVGSIFKYHGVDRLLEAYAKLTSDLPETQFRLMIVGDGMVLPELKKQASELGISAKVIFFGNVPHKDVYSYIEMMDIAVMAGSNWYGSPVKVFEYGAMSKAIVAPDNVPLRDVMNQGSEGILVGEGASDVYDALRKLVSDNELRKNLAEAFHRKVVATYTWDKVASDIISNAEMLIQKKTIHTSKKEGYN
ncbi:MAG: glycosyltransferase family 4 protein [Flavobacteriales bacterium]|nr:glycosyltransferase family 4 protein [Flavobacteriales bacterium]